MLNFNNFNNFNISNIISMLFGLLALYRVNVFWELQFWSFLESQLYLVAHEYLIRVWIAM